MSVELVKALELSQVPLLRLVEDVEAKAFRQSNKDLSLFSKSVGIVTDKVL